MKPVDQTRVSSPENPHNGNCFCACVASLLELPIEEVPDFNSMPDSWFMPFIRFLRKNGYEFGGTGKPENLKDEKGVDGFVIVEGSSYRDFVTRGHAVIYKNGILAHDPHPSKSGLKEVQNYLIITRIPTQGQNNER